MTLSNANDTIRSTDALRALNGFWYVATPYSKYPGGLDAAYDDTLDVVVALMAENIVAYSPIVHCHDIAKRKDLGTTHDFWRNYNEAMIRASAGVLAMMMPTWDRSVGLADERAYATAIGKPVLYMHPRDLMLAVPTYPAQVSVGFGGRVVLLFPDFPDLVAVGGDEREAIQKAYAGLGRAVLETSCTLNAAMPRPSDVGGAANIVHVPVPPAMRPYL